MQDLKLDDDDDKPKSISKTGIVLTGVFGGLFVGTCVLTGPFLTPALRRICLPFVPATNQQVQNVFSVLRGRGGSLLDIGSGDGRIVIEAAKQGHKASGVELNSWLVWYSRWSAYRQGVTAKTHFMRADLWRHNLASYDNIVIFGVEPMMERLERKFIEELKEGTQIVACRFPLPNMEPVKTFGVGVDTVWLYHVTNSRWRTTSKVEN